MGRHGHLVVPDRVMTAHGYLKLLGVYDEGRQVYKWVPLRLVGVVVRRGKGRASGASGTRGGKDQTPEPNKTY